MNKVVNVKLMGGIIGYLAVSPQNKLNKVIKNENRDGWHVIQVIPAASGNLFLIILRFLILLITLFLYTQTNGYYIIMEKCEKDVKGDIKSTPDKKSTSISQQKENLENKFEEKINISLSEKERTVVNYFANYGFKTGDKIVMNKKNRKIEKFDEQDWNKIVRSSQQNEWIVISEK